MIKVHIYADERYPNYGLQLDPHQDCRSVLVDQVFVDEYNAVEKSYRDMQAKLRKLEAAQE